MRLLNQTFKVLEVWIYTKLDDQIFIYSIGWVGGVYLLSTLSLARMTNSTFRLDNNHAFQRKTRGFMLIPKPRELLAIILNIAFMHASPSLEKLHNFSVPHYF